MFRYLIRSLKNNMKSQLILDTEWNLKQNNQIWKQCVYDPL